MLFRVLGPVELGDRPPATAATTYIAATKPRTVLARLLLTPNAWVGVPALVDAVWPQRRPPASAIRNIGTYVWQLRKDVPADAGGRARIENRPGSYRLRLADEDELDRDRFETLLAAGRAALSTAAAGRAAELLSAAGALWRASPYDGLDCPAAQMEVARLVELHWTGRERLAEALISAGRTADATALCFRLTVEEPLREGPWRHLLTALAAAGRTADALASYQRLHRTFVTELGTEPSPELRAMQQRLLADPPADPVPPRITAGVSDRIEASLTRALEAVAALSAATADAAEAAGPGDWVQRWQPDVRTATALLGRAAEAARSSEPARLAPLPVVA